MAGPLRSYDITDLTWVEIGEQLARDSRLIVPVGACDQHGRHLPIGATTIIAEALARDLAEEFGVLRAPTFPYGVNLKEARRCAGAADLREKTLHRALNELLACWEGQGFTEFILITAQSHDRHVDAIAAVSVTTARVRVVEALGIDLSEFVEDTSRVQRGGEVETSLLLFLRPEAVHMGAVQDEVPVLAPPRRGFFAWFTRRPVACPTSTGHPLLASADKGQRIYAHILEKIRNKVFSAPEALEA